jgi:RND family efflux transporter MFP subunit
MRLLFLLLAGLVAAGAAAQNPQIVARPLSDVALYPQRDAPAQAVPLNESRIAAEVSARIEALPVEVGQVIARGAVIARLDCRDSELALERARAAYAAAKSREELAEQQLRRARDLAERGFFSKEALATRATEVDVLRAESAQARAQARTAERQTGKCIVRAPFDAIVRERLGQVGELAAPGMPLVALADAVRIEVSARLQPRDAASLRQAKDIRFHAEIGDYEVRLARISPAVDPQARTVEARLQFAGQPAPPGAAGRIAWRASQPHVPAELLLRREGRLGVFVEEDGVARFRPLAQAQEGRPAPVELPLETRLVVSGQLGLQDGQRLH